MFNKKMLTEFEGDWMELPRGGYLANTSEGYIQFGSPPETVKDTMLLPEGAPSVFILPYDHFDPGIGISVAEIEFPTYYNFFIKKRKVVVYVHPDLVDNLRTVFLEAFLGPHKVDVSHEIEKTEECSVPDIMSEMEYFRSGLNVEDLIEIREISEKGIQIGKVSVIPMDDKGFDLFDDGRKIVHIPGRMKSQVKFDLGKTLNEPFNPPKFGVTCLGPSHGFDPTQNTSGFILWLNNMGIMVDPPVNTTAWLKDSNVNPKLIDTVILTHCHSDHDAGTFQKILEEGKIKLYTTPTIMESFLRKYSALTRIPAKTLMTMCDFRPIKINTQMNIHGGFFNFFYSVHSIPTIGFYFLYRDKTFLYSSDHLADPEKLQYLHDQGIMSRDRLDFFLGKPWEMDIIYHEAGIPPLHTPIEFLNSLPEKIQKKITCYHIAQKDFPDKTNLTLAKFGIGETLTPEIEKHRFEDAYEILDVFDRIDLFRDLPFDKSKYLLLNVKVEEFGRGDSIIKKDTEGDKFYVIVSGNVSIGGIENVQDKVYGTYEYFGEASLVLGTLRGADVKAETNVTAYSLDKQAFLRLIHDTPVEVQIRKIARIRTGETWTVIKANRFFNKLSSSQITQLEMLLTPRTIRKGETLVRPGDEIREVYLLIEGGIQKKWQGNNEEIREPGELLGDVFSMKENLPSQHKYKAKTDSRVYRMEKKEFLKFLDVNPGVLIEMIFNER